MSNESELVFSSGTHTWNEGSEVRGRIDINESVVRTQQVTVSGGTWVIDGNMIAKLVDFISGTIDLRENMSMTGCYLRSVKVQGTGKILAIPGSIRLISLISGILDNGLILEEGRVP
jgi:hypothetical protein